MPVCSFEHLSGSLASEVYSELVVKGKQMRVLDSKYKFKANPYKRHHLSMTVVPGYSSRLF